MKISNSLDYTEWFEALLINLMQLLVNLTLIQSSFLLDAISRGLLSVLAYTERLRPNGVPFSGFRYIKG